MSKISLYISNLKNNINIKELNNPITRILRYSAMKIRAKLTPLYSVLKPDTNSDSPSAKSKGVRLVSAKVVVNQTINKGASINPPPKTI